MVPENVWIEIFRSFQDKKGNRENFFAPNSMATGQRSAAMAIFLGKNYLGQSDDPNKVESSSDGPVIITGEDEIQP